MGKGRWWIALVTFEPNASDQQLLPAGTAGACGWMVALAPDEDTAADLFTRDMAAWGVRVIEIEQEQEVFSDDEINEVDAHLAVNFRNMKPGERTVWGTFFAYGGEGEA